MNPIFTPTVLRQAVRASADAYKETPTHRAGEAEGVLIDYGDGFFFGVQGTEFNGSFIIFGDMLIDIIIYPWRHPDLGWLHKGFLLGRIIPDANQGGALGLFKVAYADLAGLFEAAILVGHSKAGPQVMIVGGLLAASGQPPKAIITVDAPKFAIGKKLANVLEGVPVPLRRPASRRSAVEPAPAVDPPPDPTARLTRGLGLGSTARQVGERVAPRSMGLFSAQGFLTPPPWPLPCALSVGLVSW